MSGRSQLVVRRLDIRRTPGIVNAFSITDLCDGINIAYGPNASGKTTTAHAIQMLLWNHLSDWSRASLTGRIDLDGSEWFVDIEAGMHRCQRDGVDGARLPVEAAEHLDRYILTLHDLLQADNARFAEVILRESAGGYDLDAAAGQLNYRESPSDPRGNRNALRAARHRVNEAEREQQALAREQSELAVHQERLDAAREAIAEARALQSAIAVKARVRDVELASEALALFPASLARVGGDELERLAGIQQRIDECDERKRGHEREMQQAQATLVGTCLTSVELPPGLLQSLRARNQALQGIHGRVIQAENEMAGCRAERDRAAHYLSGHITEGQLSELEAGGLTRLAGLAREYEQARAEYDAAHALQRWIGDIRPSGDTDRLQQGISHLRTWLRTVAAPAAGTAAPPSKAPVWVSAGVIALLALLLGALAHPVFFAAVALALVPIVLAGRGTSTVAGTGRSAYARQEYEQLGLSQPRDWSVEAVGLLLDQLCAELDRQRVHHEKAQRWADRDREWREVTAKLRAREAAWRAALEEAGLEATGAPDIHLIAQNLDRWQTADSKLRAATERHTHERRGYLEQVQALNRDLAPFGYTPATDHAEILGLIEDLDDRVRRFDSATQTIQHARRTLEELTMPELERLQQEHRELFEVLDLDPGDDRQLEDLLKQRDDYDAARAALQEAEHALRHANAELGERGDLLSCDLAELESRLHEAEAQAAEEESLQKTIVATQTRIDAAKESHDLEQALVEMERAGEVLRADREAGYEQAAGWMLAGFVRDRTRDRDRPRVFHRARELFTRITQGRYELHFTDRPRPTFRATDTTTGLSHGLDELSSATRVQLLMAVRIAFVEEMEQGPKLPLILDETLGNADENRAEAIIHAACEISRGGRQIFYFTAQHDEVGKWLRILGNHPDVPHQTINLVEARHLPDSERSTLEDLQSAPPPAVPAPDGMSHREYRTVLNVPAIDPWADSGGVHLWYLIDDCQALHRLLTMGIVTWGQFRTLVHYGGDGLTSPEVFERAYAHARVLETAFKAWRTGRGRAVDGAAIIDSGAITNAFRDRVIAVANDVGGDAVTLLSALEDGAVNRLRTAYIDNLRTYLLDHGYLHDEEPLTPDDIRARVLGEAAADISTNLIALPHIDFLLACLPEED